MDNIKEYVVNYKPNRIPVVSGLEQWDFGQYLVIKDIPLDLLEDEKEIHFCFPDSLKSLVVKAEYEDNVLKAQIPRFIFQKQIESCLYSSYKAYAFVYLKTNEYGKTIYRIALEIEARPKPDDYEYEEEQLYFEELTEILDTKADKIKYSGSVLYLLSGGHILSRVPIKVGSGDGVGIDGREVELINNGTYIQWRYFGDEEWNNLVALSDLNGKDGMTPYINNGNWYIGEQNTGVKAQGVDGRGIKTLEKIQTRENIDTYKITFTDDTEFTYEVVNAPIGAIVEETDPTVPEWAKQDKKPIYTASEVGALPKDTKIPNKTSDLENDSNYVTEKELNVVKTGLTNLTTDYNNNKEFIIQVTQYTGGVLKADKTLEEINKADADGKHLVVRYYYNRFECVDAKSGGNIYFFDNVVIESNNKVITRERIIIKKEDIIEYYKDIINLTSANVSKEDIKNAVNEYLDANPITETDPTVPQWAKNPTKPTYTAREVGAVSKTEYDAYVQNTDDNIEGMRNVLVMTAPQAMMSMKTQDIVDDIAELKEGSTDVLLFDDIKVFPFNEFLQMYHVSDKTPTIHNFYNGFEIILNSNAYPILPYPFGKFSPIDENVTYEEESGMILFHLPSDVGYYPDENVFAVIPTDFELNNDGMQISIKKGLYLTEKIINADVKGINIYNFSFGEYQLKGGNVGGGSGATAEQLAQIEQNKTDIGKLSDTVNGLEKDMENVGNPTDEQVSNSVSSWLDAHPEAVTTVADGSITKAKLAEDTKLAIESSAEGIYQTTEEGSSFVLKNAVEGRNIKVELPSTDGIEVFHSGKNLLNLNRECVDLKQTGATTVRDWSVDKYYTGLSENGLSHYVGRVGSSIDVELGQVNYESTNGSYGIAFPIRMFEGITYKVACKSDTNTADIAVAFYDENSIYMSNVTRGNTSSMQPAFEFTAPTGTYWGVVIFKVRVGSSLTLTDVIVTIEGAEVLDMETVGENKNIFDMETGYVPYVKYEIIQPTKNLINLTSCGDEDIVIISGGTGNLLYVRTTKPYIDELVAGLTDKVNGFEETLRVIDAPFDIAKYDVSYLADTHTNTVDSAELKTRMLFPKGSTFGFKHSNARLKVYAYDLEGNPLTDDVQWIRYPDVFEATQDCEITWYVWYEYNLGNYESVEVAIKEILDVNLSLPSNELIIKLTERSEKKIEQLKGEAEANMTALNRAFNSAYIKNAVDPTAKVQEFCSKFVNATGDASSFMFFTDPHFYNSNSTEEDRENAIKYLQKYYNSTPTSFIVCGGDVIQNQDTKEQACYKLGYLDAIFHKMFDKYYYVFGNHDNNYQGYNYWNNYLETGNSGIDYMSEEDVLTTEQMRNLCFRDEGKTYYHFTDTMTRYYVFDCGIDWDADSMNDFRWEQVDWFANELLKNNDKHNVIVAHQMYGSSKTSVSAIADNVTKIAQAYNARTTITLNEKTYDFSTSTGTVHYYLYGHTHVDKVSTVNTIPCISTINSYVASWSEPTFDLVLADYENSKLYLVRVGQGENREVDIL